MARDVGSLELRPVTDDEFPTFARAVERSFGGDTTEAAVARWRQISELDRTLAFFEGDRIVGTAAAFSFGMSLPWARPVPCAGVTAVGVAHDWRRRGLLTAMMRRQLDDVREAGEPFAALYASESPIYGRYGYAIAASHVDLEAEAPFVAPASAADPSEVELVDAATMIAAGPELRRTHAGLRGGMMERREHWWRVWLENDEPDDRDGHSPRFHALLPGRGYAVYRVKPHWEQMLPQGQVLVIELVANDPEASAILWQYLSAIDLVRTVRAPMRPADDPLPWLVGNHQRVKVTGGEDLYLRLVDVGAALAARGYAMDGRLVFEVHDAFAPWNEGRWELEVADGRARCERTEAAADLELDARDLAAISLGGVRTTELAWARRVVARSEAAPSRADRLLAVDLAPWNSFEF